MRLTLVLPELIWPEPGDRTALEKAACPGLEKLLARGSSERRPPLPYEEALAEIFALGQYAPLGALRLLGEPPSADAPDPRRGFWLCADPVHLRFHHERIILADAGAFDLEMHESLELAAALNREFADIGQFHVADSRRWYVRLAADWDYAAPPLSAVAGRRIDGQLPERSGTAKLRSWLNEVQMFLHGHPVNAARQGTGKPAVNSLWLWGAGALPRPADPGFDGVWARDPLALGMARAAGIPTHPLPLSLAALREHADRGSHQLVVLDDLLPPAMYEDSAGWRDSVLRLEKEWFAPLSQALGGAVDSLEMIAPTIYGCLVWQLRAADRWKLWRRPKTLADLAQEFAA